jgi:hypothetical protein
MLPVASDLPAVPETAQSNFPSQEAFEAVVERCREYIHAGDCVQVVPSQRFSVPMHAKVSMFIARCGTSTRPRICFISAWAMCSSLALRPKFSWRKTTVWCARGLWPERAVVVRQLRRRGAGNLNFWPTQRARRTHHAGRLGP